MILEVKDQVDQLNQFNLRPITLSLPEPAPEQDRAERKRRARERRPAGERLRRRVQVVQ